MTETYTIDRDTNIVHIYDDLNGVLGRCHLGFAADALYKGAVDVVPTCVFCIAGLMAGLPQWRFLPKSNTYRRVIEENRDA